MLREEVPINIVLDIVTFIVSLFWKNHFEMALTSLARKLRDLLVVSAMGVTIYHQQRGYIETSRLQQEGHSWNRRGTEEDLGQIPEGYQYGYI